MAQNAKWVKVIAPGGVTCNFQGQTGTNNLQAISYANIKKMLDQGATIYEMVEDDDPIVLNSSNYNTDNGGIAVADTVQIAPDLDAEAEERLMAIQQERIFGISEYFKKKLLGTTPEDPDDEDDEEEEEGPPGPGPEDQGGGGMGENSGAGSGGGTGVGA